MTKKTGWGIAVAIVVVIIYAIGAMVFAAESGHFTGLQKDIRTVLGGVLSPRQISALMDFRRNHDETFHRKADEHPDLFKTWKELNLSEEQQEQLLKVAGDLIDKTHPYLTTLIETGGELKRQVLDVKVLCPAGCNSRYPAITELSARLGTDIGEIFWNLALVRNQVRSVLTPEQMGIMEQRRSKHDLRLKTAAHALPDMAEDLAALWSELKLTTNQADALESAHKLITKHRQDRVADRHSEWRADLAKILTSEQLAATDRFHDTLVGEGGIGFLKMGEERERFYEALALTGEQKIKLIQIALDRRSRIVPALQDFMNAAGALREQVHADIPDRSALMAAAATLGDAVGRAAEAGAELMAEAREVLTTEQMDLIKGHIDDHLDQHLEHARIMPARFHELIDFLNKLSLTPGQKDQVVKLIAEKHEAQWAKHQAMKRAF